MQPGDQYSQVGQQPNGGLGEQSPVPSNFAAQEAELAAAQRRIDELSEMIRTQHDREKELQARLAEARVSVMTGPDPSTIVAAVTENFATVMRRFCLTKFRYVNEASNGTETWEFEMLPATHEERIRRTLADPHQREIPHANLATPEDAATAEARKAAEEIREEQDMYGHLG